MAIARVVTFEGVSKTGWTMDRECRRSASGGIPSRRLIVLHDLEPKGEVARAYRCTSRTRTSERALYVIDGDGVMRWSYVSPVGFNPGADGILSALEATRSRRETGDARLSGRPRSRCRSATTATTSRAGRTRR